MDDKALIHKIWNLCHILRGDGISYHEYISELTYLLFLKLAEETGTEALLPEDCRWSSLLTKRGDELLVSYRDILTKLGGHAPDKMVREIYEFPTTVFSHGENLWAVIDGINKLDWHSITRDRMGVIYEGLLAKNSQDSRSGAGQYFTPRPLVDLMVDLVMPAPGEIIQDPSTGSGGFLIAADRYIRSIHDERQYNSNPPKYEGVEIEKETYRICLMNVFLHGLNAHLIKGDALTDDAVLLSKADVVLANPPFGVKAGSARARRDSLLPGTNKQIAFLQHIFQALNEGGRAAVVVPDNVLFEDGAGKRVRQEILSSCSLTAILRLPTGIFYSPGVKTNVLFFTLDPRGTSSTLVYDMRTNAPRYGKKRPLSRSEFAEFQRVYLSAPPLVDDSGEHRWKIFSREDFASRDDDLDVWWLKALETRTPEEFSDLDDLLAELGALIEDASIAHKDLVTSLDQDAVPL